LSIKDAEVEITFDPPWSKDLMSEEGRIRMLLKKSLKFV
jgi:metal-sulfur cluster biosynthetic enzyme